MSDLLTTEELARIQYIAFHTQDYLASRLLEHIKAQNEIQQANLNIKIALHERAKKAEGEAASFKASQAFTLEWAESLRKKQIPQEEEIRQLKKNLRDIKNKTSLMPAKMTEERVREIFASEDILPCNSSELIAKGYNYCRDEMWPVKSQWMPIDTAPQDGTKILLKDKGGNISSGYCGKHTWLWPYVNSPAEWMPLP